MSADAPHRFITIPFSHYCEKARWALDRVGVAYREEAYPPLLHYRATAPLRLRTVPILVAGPEILGDSTDILHYADRFAPPGKKLFPDDPDERREVSELEELFDRSLGPAARRWGYGGLFEYPTMLRELFVRGRSGLAAAAIGAALPGIMALMRRGLAINPAAVARSTAKLEELFAKIDARLADGRRYLVGDRFTAADLTFATLAAPAIIPPPYGDYLFPIERMPPNLLSVVQRRRAQPSGALVMRLFAEERGARV